MGMLLIADFPSKPQRKVSLLDVQSALGASKPTATREQKKGGERENWTRGWWISPSVPGLGRTRSCRRSVWSPTEQIPKCCKVVTVEWNQEPELLIPDPYGSQSGIWSNETHAVNRVLRATEPDSRRAKGKIVGGCSLSPANGLLGQTLCVAFAVALGRASGGIARGASAVRANRPFVEVLRSWKSICEVNLLKIFASCF